MFLIFKYLIFFVVPTSMFQLFQPFQRCTYLFQPVPIYILLLVFYYYIIYQAFTFFCLCAVGTLERWNTKPPVEFLHCISLFNVYLSKIWTGSCFLDSALNSALLSSVPSLTIFSKSRENISLSIS